MNGDGASQTQPKIIGIGGVVYGLTPTLDVIALKGASGDLLWSFSGLDGPSDFKGPSRGLSMWKEGDKKILFAGLVDKLFAIDPDSGDLVVEFGDDGVLDLRTGLPGDASRGYYISMSSPGVIYRDTIIVGFRTAENPPAPG